jgi:predicted RNA-binding Zn-ribbon protein involved in translation (DUF1610 family)
MANRGTPSAAPKQAYADCVGQTPRFCPHCNAAEIVPAKAVRAHRVLEQGGETPEGRRYVRVSWHRYQCPECGGVCVIRLLRAGA